MHFTLGEALSVIASGWASEASLDPLFLETRQPVSEPDYLKSILDELCTGAFISSGNQTVRKAAAIWLLSFVKYVVFKRGEGRKNQTKQKRKKERKKKKTTKKTKQNTKHKLSMKNGFMHTEGKRAHFLVSFSP